MTNLETLENKLAEVKAAIKVEVATLYLTELFEKATLTSSEMIKLGYNSGPSPCFRGGASILIDRNLESKVRRAANHFKTIDDSQAYPEWRNKAIAAAKTLDFDRSIKSI